MYMGKDIDSTPCTIDKEGNVSFESGGKNYTIQFHTDFYSNGLPKSKTFDGNARPSGINEQGKETRDPDSVWNGSLTRESFVGLVITFAVPFILAYVAHMQNREQEEEAIRNEARAFERVFQHVPPIEERIQQGVDEVGITDTDLSHVTAAELEKDGHISDAMYDAMRRHRNDNPNVTKAELSQVAKDAAKTYLEGRYRSVIRSKVYAHLGQQSYKTVVEVARQYISNAAGINEEATKIVDDSVEAHVKQHVQHDLDLLQPSNEFFDAVVDAGWGEVELERKDQSLDTDLSEIEKKYWELDRDVKSYEKIEQDYKQEIEDHPLRDKIKQLDITIKTLQEMRQQVEKAEQTRDAELEKIKKSKEAIDHQKDPEREDKRKEIEDARKKAQDHRGSLVK